MLVPEAGSTDEMKNSVAPGAAAVNMTSESVAFSSMSTVFGKFVNSGGSRSSSMLSCKHREC